MTNKVITYSAPSGGEISLTRSQIRTLRHAEDDSRISIAGMELMSRVAGPPLGIGTATKLASQLAFGRERWIVDRAAHDLLRYYPTAAEHVKALHALRLAADATP